MSLTPSTDVSVSKPLPDWLSLAKVHPPRQKVQMLRRPGLEVRLSGSAPHALALISAPAGYGKSTLLASWLQSPATEGMHKCWLTLDPDDNATGQLEAYLALALHLGGAVDATLVDAAVSHADNHRSFINRLNNAIARAGAPVVLVLDELEHLREEVLAALIQPLLQGAPANLHLFIATRDDRTLDISRFEAAGSAVRIGAQALQLTIDEIGELIGDRVSSAELVEIAQRTGGWAVAVQLLRASMEAERDHPRLLRELSSEQHAMWRFLSAQVVDALEPGDVEFLMDIAIVKHISCAMADHLRQTEDSLRRLSAMRSLSALIRPVEGVDATFTLHPLLREHLYQRLSTTNQERVKVLHLRAAEWNFQRGDLISAVRHAVVAKRQAVAAQMLVDLGGLSLWLREGITRIRAALQLLDRELIDNTPRLLLLQCIIDIKDGRVFQAGKHYAQAEALANSRNGRATPSERAVLGEELALMDAYLAIYFGKRIRETSYRHVLESTNRIEALDYDRLGFHYTLLCVMNTQSGDFPRARHFAGEAIRVFRQIDSLYGETYIYFHSGDISFAAGDCLMAEEHYRHGLELARRHFREDKGMRLIGQTMLIELLDELGRSDYSEAILRALPRELEAREAWFEIYAAGYCTTSNIELRISGLAAALRIIDRAERYAERQQLQHLGKLLVWQRIELLVRSGHVRRARKVADRSGLAIEQYRPDTAYTAAWRETAAAALACGNLLLAEGRATEAIAAVEPFASNARRLGHTRSLIRYGLLQCLAHRNQGNPETALLTLEHVLDLARSSGFLRPLLDAGPALEYLLEDCRGRPLQAEQMAFIDALLARRAEGSAEQPAVNETLSAREQEILRQVARGLSNKQVARTLDISENTVRFHLKNVFLKLRVHNRTEAVAQGLHRGILEQSVRKDSVPTVSSEKKVN